MAHKPSRRKVQQAAAAAVKRGKITRAEAAAVVAAEAPTNGAGLVERLADEKADRVAAAWATLKRLHGGCYGCSGEDPYCEGLMLTPRVVDGKMTMAFDPAYPGSELDRAVQVLRWADHSRKGAVKPMPEAVKEALRERAVATKAERPERREPLGGVKAGDRVLLLDPKYAGQHALVRALKVNPHGHRFAVVKMEGGRTINITLRKLARPEGEGDSDG